MKILNLYCSYTGNTAKVATQIKHTALAHSFTVDSIEVIKNSDENAVDFLEYDFIFAGCGVYSWLPPDHMMQYINRQNKKHINSGDIKSCSARLADKKAVMYCTYGGPHTGINEGLVVPKYLGQLFDHLGFEIVAEWHFPGAFNSKGYTQFSKDGRLGDITGRPNEQDLSNINQMVTGILRV